jgi:N-hydroxyarylamine O-acetyltransferase
MSNPIDLAKYAERIGFLGEFRVDFATLSAIQFGQSTHIPFENLDILRKIPVSIDTSDLERKLVIHRRGGYCFEQNGLLLAVLQQIGFVARPHAARVRIGNERTYLPPRTHLFVQVDLDGKTWIVDSGVGSMSLTSPVQFVEDVEQETLHEPRRIVREDGVYFHQVLVNGEWEDAYEFSGEQMPMIDREVSNWWTSTSPKAKFSQNMMASLARPNGERYGLYNGIFIHRHDGVVLRKVEIENDEQLIFVLKEEFGLEFEAGTDFGSVGCPWRNL